jgi:hypothetical protein
MEIPPYPASRSLDMSDKPLLDEVFNRLQPRVSEFTFANLYLFRSAHAYRLTLVGEALVVLGKGYGGEDYFMPPLTGDITRVLAVLFGDGLTLYGADEAFAQSYLRGVRLDLWEDRDSFDYLYLRAELAELPGNRFHKKKNRINYFASRHSFAIEPYAGRHLAGSLALLDEWQRVHAGLESRSLALETEATREALEMARELGLQGVVVLVENAVRAFALGEKLNEATSVCHFEKADPFLEGLYQLVDREFNRLLFTDCTWVNREQDLGEQNLRESKLSYHPVELVKKVRARYNSTLHSR